MFELPWQLNTRRKKQWQKAPDGPLKAFLSVPFPSSSLAIEQTPILAVDFETTGLNAKHDQLLSVGFVALENSQIYLSSAYHQLISTRGELNEQNVLIHQITDEAKSKGANLSEVVETLLKALTGKVMLVHFNRIEKTFLQQACLQLYGMAPVLPMIDTLMIAKRRFDRSGQPYDPSSLRLGNLRQFYHLPDHTAHNALGDAIATAELFLAQVAAMEQGEQTRLKNILL